MLDEKVVDVEQVQVASIEEEVEIKRFNLTSSPSIVICLVGVGALSSMAMKLRLLPYNLDRINTIYPQEIVPSPFNTESNCHRIRIRFTAASPHFLQGRIELIFGYGRGQLIVLTQNKQGISNAEGMELG
jgi:hypothetical protein